MPKFSRDDRRSTASFFISFGVHFGLIICFALVLFDFQVGDSVLLSVSHDADDALLFESPAPPQPNESAAADLDSLETEPVKLEEIELDDLMTTSLLNDGEFDWDRILPGDLTLNPALEPALELETTKGFFGIEATGQRVVYVIDMSFSMRVHGYRGQRRYDRAVSEVLSSVEQLRPDQTFYVILFCFDKFEMNIGQSPGGFCAPTRVNKRRLKSWLTSVQLGSGTDPRESIVTALQLKPSCLFLLSDGEFNGRQHHNGQFGNRSRATELAKAHNAAQCPIHTIGLEDRANQRDMTLIAQESGGQYKFISAAGR